MDKKIEKKELDAKEDRYLWRYCLVCRICGFGNFLPTVVKKLVIEKTKITISEVRRVSSGYIPQTGTVAPRPRFLDAIEGGNIKRYWRGKVVPC